MMRMIRNAIHEHHSLWLTIVVLSVSLYHALLLLVLIVRFGALPNYFLIYDLASNCEQIWKNTPALTDALQIMMAEPRLELGYRDPAYFNIAEWSFMLLPLHFIGMIFTAMLFSTLLVLMRSHRDKTIIAAHKTLRARKIIRTGESEYTSRTAFVMATVSACVLGIANATLTWVVCCATPSWVVLISMLGINPALSLRIEPYGKLLTIAGVALGIFAIATEARIIQRLQKIEFNAVRYV